MIYHQRGQKLKLAQILELLFFAAIIGAFILLIPMKARAEEEQLMSRRGANSLESSRFETGEKLQDVENLSSDKFGATLEWSEQLTLSLDHGPGDKE